MASFIRASLPLKCPLLSKPTPPVCDVNFLQKISKVWNQSSVIFFKLLINSSSKATGQQFPQAGCFSSWRVNWTSFVNLVKCPFKSPLLPALRCNVLKPLQGSSERFWLPCALWSLQPASWHGDSSGWQQGPEPPPWTGRAGTGPEPAPRDWWDWREPLWTWRKILQRDGI